MRIEFLTNNPNTLSLSRWLKESAGEEVYIIEDKLTPEILQRHGTDLVISYGYRHIIPSNVLEMLPQRFINLHISYLPWNRGADPNTWSFLENSPKGVSIHLIDAGIDTGDLLLQEEIFFDENNETLASSYKTLHVHIQNLFRKNWQQIKVFEIEPQKQSGEGTFHLKKDFEKVKDYLLGQEGLNVPIPLLLRRYEKLKNEIKNRN